MKIITKEQRHFYFWVGCIIVCLAIIIACIGVCAYHAAVFDVEADKPTEPGIVPIVYTDEESEDATAPTPFYPLTLDEREWFAELVAGKAVGEPAGCQQAAATVLFNDLIDCGGNMHELFTRYSWGDTLAAADETYEAVDAVFLRGEVLLDDDVLWMGPAGQADAFHAGLEEVCTIGGITFYRER